MRTGGGGTWELVLAVPGSSAGTISLPLEVSVGGLPCCIPQRAAVRASPVRAGATSPGVDELPAAGPGTKSGLLCAGRARVYAL